MIEETLDYLDLKMRRALKMEFTLKREREEAERKRIEAKGISDFQKIVSAGDRWFVHAHEAPLPP